MPPYHVNGDASQHQVSLQKVDQFRRYIYIFWTKYQQKDLQLQTEGQRDSDANVCTTIPVNRPNMLMKGKVIYKHKVRKRLAQKKQKQKNLSASLSLYNISESNKRSIVIPTLNLMSLYSNNQQWPLSCFPLKNIKNISLVFCNLNWVSISGHGSPDTKLLKLCLNNMNNTYLNIILNLDIYNSFF